MLNLSALLMASCAVAANPGCPWPATDALGRRLPVAGEAPAPRADRFVGMFYFLWHDKATVARKPDGLGPYNIAQILAADPQALEHPQSPLWGPRGTYHYWAEPWCGYYQSDDPWVIRQHARMLSEAGIDTLIFDTTNAATYHETYLKLCEVFTQVRAEGGQTPQIAFMVNTEAGKTAQKLYDEFYGKGLYPDLWFRWQGKPLLLCDPAAATPQLREFFTLRAAHWPFELVNTHNGWHWEATYPQPYSYDTDPAKPEQVNVSVAQNLRAADGRVTNMSNGDARGRGFHDGQADHATAALDSGANFAEQWRRAIELDPPFVLVTGWNEWIAGNWGEPGQRPMFVDQFDREYSRDIEPMRGGHGDNYYYQLVANVRRYKGVPPLPRSSGPKTIRIDGGFEQWADVQPEYRGTGSTDVRDHDGAGGVHYSSTWHASNAFVSMKVAHDSANLYFYARMARSPRRAALLIDTPIGRYWVRFAPNGNGGIDAGGTYHDNVESLHARPLGTEVHLALPYASLFPPGRAPDSIDFAWIEGDQGALLTTETGALDGTDTPGPLPQARVRPSDRAPLGRFEYRYVLAP